MIYSKENPWLGPYDGRSLSLCACGCLLIYLADPDLPPPDPEDIEALRRKAKLEKNPVAHFSVKDGDPLICPNCGRKHKPPAFDPGELRRQLEARMFQINKMIAEEVKKESSDTGRLEQLKDNRIDILKQLLRISIEEKGGTLPDDF